MISTHAPLAGRDVYCVAAVGCGPIFQPTRPLRGATLSLRALPLMSSIFQPTRPLRGATSCGARSRSTKRFQPTRPLRGATARGGSYKGSGDKFQPTRPLRGATAGGAHRRRRGISTHAPLAGRDSKRVQITMHIFAITDKFQMLLHRMPPVRAFCSFLMQENHADFGCEPPK